MKTRPAILLLVSHKVVVGKNVLIVFVAVSGSVLPVNCFVIINLYNSFNSFQPHSQESTIPLPRASAASGRGRPPAARNDLSGQTWAASLRGVAAAVSGSRSVTPVRGRQPNSGVSNNIIDVREFDRRNHSPHPANPHHRGPPTPTGTTHLSAQFARLDTAVPAKANPPATNQNLSTDEKAALFDNALNALMEKGLSGLGAPKPDENVSVGTIEPEPPVWESAIQAVIQQQQMETLQVAYQPNSSHSKAWRHPQVLVPAGMTAEDWRRLEPYPEEEMINPYENASPGMQQTSLPVEQPESPLRTSSMLARTTRAPDSVSSNSVSLRQQADRALEDARHASSKIDQFMAIADPQRHPENFADLVSKATMMFGNALSMWEAVKLVSSRDAVVSQLARHHIEDCVNCIDRIKTISSLGMQPLPQMEVSQIREVSEPIQSIDQQPIVSNNKDQDLPPGHVQLSTTVKSPATGEFTSSDSGITTTITTVISDNAASPFLSNHALNAVRAMLEHADGYDGHVSANPSLSFDEHCAHQRNRARLLAIKKMMSDIE